MRQINSDIDHRLLTTPVENSFYTPVNEDTRGKLWKAFMDNLKSREQEGSGSELVQNDVSIPVMMNRFFVVPYSSGDSCFLHFSDVCERDKAAADYKAICDRYRAVYLHGIPVMTILTHDVARRFITLIDELYDARVRLVWTAERDPMELFKILSPLEIEVFDILPP